MTYPIGSDNGLRIAAQQCIEQSSAIQQVLREQMVALQAIDAQHIETLQGMDYLRGIHSRLQASTQSLEEIDKVQESFSNILKTKEKHVALREEELSRLNAHNQRLRTALNQQSKHSKGDFEDFLQTVGIKCSHYISRKQHDESYSN